ncbi:MAG: hypothetical protein AAGU75_13830 [Bacillota bacterium]
MKSNLSGFVGGVVGGLIKLIIDQISYAVVISTVDTIGTFSGILFGGSQYLQVWIIYLFVTGLAGWLISMFITEKNLKFYVTVGIFAGVTLWAVMNIIFAATGFATPTWAMGTGSFIVNLITHAVLGITITYTMWAYKSRSARTS